MATRAPLPIALPRGRHWTADLRAGTTLVAAAGTLHVTQAPAWLGERPVRTVHRLRTGEALVLPNGGWVELQALSDARLAVLPPAPAPSVGEWVRRAVAAGRQWMRYPSRGRSAAAKRGSSTACTL